MNCFYKPFAVLEHCGVRQLGTLLIAKNFNNPLKLP